jgi:hypothetical protein
MNPHNCGQTCDCRKDLDAALAALEKSTELLASTLKCNKPWQIIEVRYAEIRAAQVKLKGAIAAYFDHFKEAGLSPSPEEIPAI